MLNPKKLRAAVEAQLVAMPDATTPEIVGALVADTSNSISAHDMIAVAVVVDEVRAG